MTRAVPDHQQQTTETPLAGHGAAPGNVETLFLQTRIAERRRETRSPKSASNDLRQLAGCRFRRCSALSSSSRHLSS
eukprot:11577849-Alexandrium_andersonii.AAC.1